MERGLRLLSKARKENNRASYFSSCCCLTTLYHNKDYFRRPPPLFKPGTGAVSPLETFSYYRLRRLISSARHLKTSLFVSENNGPGRERL